MIKNQFFLVCLKIFFNTFSLILIFLKASKSFFLSWVYVADDLVKSKKSLGTIWRTTIFHINFFFCKKVVKKGQQQQTKSLLV